MKQEYDKSNCDCSHGAVDHSLAVVERGKEAYANKIRIVPSIICMKMRIMIGAVMGLVLLFSISGLVSFVQGRQVDGILGQEQDRRR